MARVGILWQMPRKVCEIKQPTGSYPKLSKKGMAGTALHFEKLMLAKKCKKMKRTAAMITVKR